MKYFFVNRCSKWECTRNAGAYENPPHVSSPLKIFTSPDSSSAMEIEGIKKLAAMEQSECRAGRLIIRRDLL
jgi:hypothetical protein